MTNRLQSVVEFLQDHPCYGLDFGAAMGRQKRIYDLDCLRKLPHELEPSYDFRPKSGRGRPNLNQTLTHFQCKTCKRVLRNDQFYLSPSLMRRNTVSSHCIACSRKRNAARYSLHAAAIRNRRNRIWRYLAARCSVCGFDRHESAMDMHHLSAKEDQISSLITDLALAPSLAKAEKLLCEAEYCIPLCSNCHRMVHAGVLELPPNLPIQAYELAAILSMLDENEE